MDNTAGSHSAALPLVFAELCRRLFLSVKSGMVGTVYPGEMGHAPCSSRSNVILRHTFKTDAFWCCIHIVNEWVSHSSHLITAVTIQSTLALDYSLPASDFVFFNELTRKPSQTWVAVMWFELIEIKKMLNNHCACWDVFGVFGVVPDPTPSSRQLFSSLMSAFSQNLKLIFPKVIRIKHLLCVQVHLNLFTL